MTMETIKKHGEYLGLDHKEGYIYSVFRGYDKSGKKEYAIVSIKDGDIVTRILFTGII
jgi:hypothetical protein